MDFMPVKILVGSQEPCITPGAVVYSQGNLMSPKKLQSRSPRADSLAVLAQRAQEGADVAFEELHHRLGGGLKKFLFQRTGAPEDVIEELAQRTWVEAWRALSARKYDPSRAAFSTFLYGIGYKLLLRHRTGIERSARVFCSLEESRFPALAEQADPGELLDFCALLEALRSCLDESLDDEERQVVERCTSGATERSLAMFLQVAASTVHARKKAAYEKLRRCLAQKGFRSGFRSPEKEGL
ncbi:MAG: RNA polymerase sigma factor [Planctomycetota bacterium]